MSSAYDENLTVGDTVSQAEIGNAVGVGGGTNVTETSSESTDDQINEIGAGYEGKKPR